MAVRRSVMAVTFTAVGYFGVTKLVDWGTQTLADAANYQMKVQEVEDLKKSHADEIARRDADTVELETEYAKFKKAARIEGGKYRQLREALQSVNDWNGIDVPEPVRRLLNNSAKNEVHSPDGSSETNTSGN